MQWEMVADGTPCGCNSAKTRAGCHKVREALYVYGVDLQAVPLVGADQNVSRLFFFYDSPVSSSVFGYSTTRESFSNTTHPPRLLGKSSFAIILCRNPP